MEASILAIQAMAVGSVAYCGLLRPCRWNTRKTRATGRWFICRMAAFYFRC